MNWEIKSCLALSAFLASSLGAVEPGSKVTVFVYNYAAVPPEALALTQAEASRIYQQAGIEIQWLECPLAPKDADQFPACQVPPGPTRLALRILSRSMADCLRQAEDSFGFAMIPEGGTFATVANVFSYDADQLANRRGMRHGVILGHLAAHELGHLLLGAGSHSSLGIMHVPWRLKELDVIAQGLMVFTPQQTESMRTNIRARTAGERATEEPPAPRTATANLSAASSEVFVHETSSTAVPAECLNIHLYNLAGVSSRTLDGATQDAARALATAGVNKVCWHVLAEAQEAHTLHTSPPPTWRKNRQTDSRGYLVAVIVSSVPVDYFPGALGYALPGAEIGVNAVIFYDRIQRFKASGEIELPTLLGHAMAHEVGHVLLGTTEHSPAGIMKARWSKADFEVAGLPFLNFTPLQRAEVQHRGLILSL